MPLLLHRLARAALVLALAATAAVLVPPPTPAAAASGHPCAARDPLPADLGAELAARYPGRRFSVGVYEPTGCVYHLNPGLRMTTASVVKTEVMAAVLLRAQRERRGLTSWERERIAPMIRESANRPTTELIHYLGGVPALEAADRDFGLVHTAHQLPYWGLATTSTRDQLHLLRQVAAGELGPLTAPYRAEALRYLRSVTPAQRWGASAGVPAGWTVAQKNGFAGSRCCRWRLNTTGWVERPDGTGWAVVVLSDGWASEAEGVSAVHALTGRINRAMAPSVLSAPGAAFAGGDRQDVFVRGHDGALWQRVWRRGRPLSAWHRLGGSLTSSPDAVDRGPAVADVVARGRDYAAWRWFWDGSSWRTQRLGGACASGPAAAASPGRFDVACRGTDGQLWLRTWTSTAGWSGWQGLGGRISSDPDVAVSGGLPTLVARGTDAAVWQWTWDGSRWRYASLGGRCRSAPTAVATGTSSLTVACRGTDDALWHRTGHAGSWTGWSSAGGRLMSDPDAVWPGSGQPVQFVGRGSDGGVWSWVRRDDGTWRYAAWQRP